MASEIVAALGGLTLTSVYGIFSIDGANTWNASTMTAVSGISDANFGSLGAIALTAKLTATSTKTGAWVGDWPSGLSTAGYYRVCVYSSTPVPNAEIGVSEFHWDGTTLESATAVDWSKIKNIRPRPVASLAK